MKNRIALIRPPSVMKGTSFIASQFPLNIAGMAALLMKNGFQTKIYDLDVGPFSEERFISDLREFSPSILGISCYTPTIINGHKIASLVKGHMPDVLIVAGGPHISALPEESILEFDCFDIGVIGEGEDTMSEIAEARFAGKAMDKIAGIVYRKDGLPVITAVRSPIRDLDRLPFPARELLNIHSYKGQSHRGFSRDFLKITEIMTSRGCPNRCIFCASDVVMAGGVRFRSSESVRREIEECIDRYGFNHFTISDDTFTLKEDRLYEICEAFAKYKVTWNCNARVWPLSKKILAFMVKAGCAGITFGVESGSPRILKLIKKNATVAQVEDAFRWAREAGVRFLEADIIIASHPSETKEDLDMTRRLLRKISPDIVMVSILVPYPGTEVYKIMRDKNLIMRDKRWDSFVLFGKEPSWRTDNFGPRELIDLQKETMARFYFRPVYILKTIARMRSVREFAYWVRAGIEFLLKCIEK